jgi:hypothetical protein
MVNERQYPTHNSRPAANALAGGCLAHGRCTRSMADWDSNPRCATSAPDMADMDVAHRLQYTEYLKQP